MSKPSRTRWTHDAILDEIMKYKTRKEFIDGSWSAYVSAISTHKFMLDIYYGKVENKWCNEFNVISEALKYPTITDFQRGNWSAYKSALLKFPHVLEHLFDSRKTFWTSEMVITELEGFRDRADFKRKKKNAYQYAVKHCPEILDSHLDPTRSGKDNDAIYIWKAVGQFFNGDQVYKVGVTSHRLGDSRVRDVSKLAGFDYEVVCIVRVKHKATSVEKKLHNLGISPKYQGFAGCTEFRAFSENDMEKVMKIIKEEMA